MSSLREALQRLRSEQLPPSRSCDLADAPVRALQIHVWEGKKWVLPWAYFYAVDHQATNECEQLIFSFARHEVTAEGTCLAHLLPTIAGFRIECLRSLPASFRVQVEKSEPFITHVSVRVLVDLGSSKNAEHRGLL